MIPGGISDTAREWLAAGGDSFTLDGDLPLDQQRALREAHYAPHSARWLAHHDLTQRDMRVAGIPCCEVIPANPHPDRVLVYLFGGGFVFGSPHQDMAIIAALAAHTNTRVWAPYYSLAPEHPYPAALDDCTRVLNAALDQFPGNVALTGESAGATLALAATLRCRAAGTPVPRALGLMSPATDQGDFGDSYLTARDPVLDPGRVDAVSQIYAPGRDLTDPGISPIYGAFDADFPPAMITTGTRDLFLSSCVRLARVLRDAGAPVDLRVWEGMWHAFEFYGDLPEAQASLRDLAAFVFPTPT